MAILGKLVDLQTVSRVGDALTGVTVGTLSHSLPGTTPQFQMVQVVSIAALGHQPNPAILAVGGNASIQTVGYAVPSTASCPTVAYKLAAMVFHSLIS